MSVISISENEILAKKNPFLGTYNTPYQTIPFNEISVSDYKPAFEYGIKKQNTEIEKIIANKAAPTFENTIIALENSGEIISKTSSVFYNLLSAETNDSLETLAQEISPILTENGNKIFQNQALFERVKTVYNAQSKLQLTNEDKELLERTYQGFIRSGANLNDKDKQEYTELSSNLSRLTLAFSQNVLKETNAFSLLITGEKDLKGLPSFVIEAAKQKAKSKDKTGWLFDLSMPSYLPFMQYAENRDLRKQLYLAYNKKGYQENEFDNQKIVKEIVNSRLRLANLMEEKNYADFALQQTMAKNTESVYKLINQLLETYKPVAEKEFNEVLEFARKTTNDKFELMPWDWAFYSEKLKEEKFKINDEQLKPYFELERVKSGIFWLANKLYDLNFKKNTEIRVYHPDVEAYEVTDNAGNFVAILYTDFHPREGKKGGAWMTEYKEQWIKNGKNSRPHISIVMNFTPPTDSTPSLLTFDELTTLLHEFGHALHGMLSQTTYSSLSGTNVYRDFVELPSQILENWATEKEFLDQFAQHYITGEKIPQEYITKIKEAENFNVGYACVRQLSFCFLDMAWHTLENPFEGNVKDFETKAWQQTLLFPTIEGTCMSTQFNHIFSGGYASGYYSYKWAEVLDADAFSVFKANGVFDKKTANSFKENILTKGGTENPMTLYKKFRGQEPTIDALLKRNGIK